MSSHSGYRWIYVPLFAGILLYSQVTTLDWDEGFHLVAASLIAAGKRPYIDFCFPQPPLQAWWNALWVSLTGGSWRGPHLIAALFTCGAVWLTGEFVYRRFPESGWQAAAAIVAAMLTGLNAILWEFGTSAQAYGSCTLLTVAAFLAATGRAGFSRSFAAGCLAGAAAACSLLAAPAGAVLVVWQVWRRKWGDAGTCLLGLASGTSPVWVFLIRAPYATWFNLVDYHVFFRRAHWTGATGHDMEILMSWVDSGQALVLGLLAAAGLWYVRKSDWSGERKSEFYLTAWMAAGLAIEAAVAHPTFAQYFVFLAPFLAMPAAIGFIEAARRLSVRPGRGIAVLAAVLLLSLVNSLVEMRADNNTWTGMELLAREVERVTPANGVVLADPPVYFAMHQAPPSGMEFAASHKMDLPAAMATALHILPQSEMERRVRAGEFATVETCKGDEEEIQALELSKYYSQSAEMAGCDVYWGHR